MAMRVRMQWRPRRLVSRSQEVWYLLWGTRKGLTGVISANQYAFKVIGFKKPTSCTINVPALLISALDLNRTLKIDYRVRCRSTPRWCFPPTMNDCESLHYPNELLKVRLFPNFSLSLHKYTQHYFTYHQALYNFLYLLNLPYQFDTTYCYSIYFWIYVWSLFATITLP